MSDEEESREIKPRSPVPASHDAIVSDIPEVSLDVSLASDLVGMKRAHFKKVVREGLEESIGQTATLQQIAEVFSVTRPDTSVLCDAHFTTEAGMERLINLINYLDNPGEIERKSEDELELNKVYSGSVIDHVREFPLESVQTVVTSPPYWGTRMYSDEFDVEWSDGQTVPYGGESTPEDYIRHTIELLLQIRPLLKEDGTIWWNLGDVYNTRTQIRETSLERMNAVRDGDEESWAELSAKRHSAGHEYLKDKDLTFIPFRLATGLQRAGFWVRSAIVWEKRNVVPETVQDRPTDAHELILLISKSKQYKFNEKQWRESDKTGKRTEWEMENLRTVWEMKTASGDNGHAAPFPVSLPARCITLSTDEDDVVYDPFMGSGTTAVAARQLDRPYVGSEIVEEYIDITNKRLREEVEENGDKSRGNREDEAVTKLEDADLDRFRD